MAYQRIRHTWEYATDSAYQNKTPSAEVLEVTSTAASKGWSGTLTITGGCAVTLSRNSLMNATNWGHVEVMNTTASGGKYVTVGWTDGASTANSSRVPAQGILTIPPGTSTDITITAQSGAGTATVAVRYSDV